MLTQRLWFWTQSKKSDARDKRERKILIVSSPKKWHYWKRSISQSDWRSGGGSTWTRRDGICRRPPYLLGRVLSLKYYKYRPIPIRKKQESEAKSEGNTVRYLVGRHCRRWKAGRQITLIYYFAAAVKGLPRYCTVNLSRLSCLYQMCSKYRTYCNWLVLGAVTWLHKVVRRESQAILQASNNK